jgi:hypothetical protein
MTGLLAYIGLDVWQASYGLVSLLAIIMAHCLGGFKRRGVASALFLLWVLNIFYTEMTQNLTPVIFFAIGDLIIGSFILWSAKNNWQRGIGSWFIVMMVAHIAFWIQEPQTAEVKYAYWKTFTALGWGQLCHVVIWTVKDIRASFFTALSKNFNLGMDV